jgi:hypothetical protein
MPLNLTGAVAGAVVSVTNTRDGGGDGILAQGGSIAIGGGGLGVEAHGGNSNDGSGGPGVLAQGGHGSGAGLSGGPGVFAFGSIGMNGATDGRAAIFGGDVEVHGNFSANGMKNFKIDHPLDPQNKYLYHAAIESSEVLNIYSGNVLTDQNGDAVVTLPDWFQALNKDLRYQLTVIGTFAQAIVAEKVSKNRFTIRTSAPRVEVSWQVIGVRSDAVMLKHAFNPEQDKPESERGTYLSPEAYGQPEERGVEWARHPELMQKVKEMREQAKQKRSPGDDQSGPTPSVVIVHPGAQGGTK